jgi:hypothetical protein
MAFFHDYILKMTKGILGNTPTFEECRTLEGYERDYISSTRASLDYAYILGSIGR